MGAHDLTFAPARPPMSPSAFARLAWLNRQGL